MAGKRRRPPAPGRRRSRLSGHEARQVLRVIIWSMGAADIVWGAGYVLGAPASTPSLQIMASVAPLPIWFGSLVVAGGLLFSQRFDSIGFALGGLVIVVYLVFTVVAGTWSWPLLADVAFLHALGVWITGRLVRRTPRG